MSLINVAISSLILICYFFYIAIVFLKRKIIVKWYLALFYLIMLVSCSTFVYYFSSNFTRTIIDFVMMSIAFMHIFKEKLIRCLAVSVACFIYICIAEILFGLLLCITLGADSIEISQHWAGGIPANFMITSIAVFLFQFDKLKSLLNNLIDVSVRIPSGYIFFVLIFAIGILTNENFKFLGNNVGYILNLFLVILFGIVIYYLFKEKENSQQLSLKYDQLFSYIQRYEHELNKKNMTIHEFNNQLIVLKDYAKGCSKRMNDYLDSIVEDLDKTNSPLLKDMENLPKGGLKGIIYYKLGDLTEEKINVITNIEKNLKKNGFSKLDLRFYRDIVKIIGVLLDNAIEAARASNKRQILLEIYLRGHEFNFILSNTYSGNLKLTEFGQIGYSTKGKGRGYGLALASQIINKYNSIKLEREVINDYFVVHLIIDLKNTLIKK